MSSKKVDWDVVENTIRSSDVDIFPFKDCTVLEQIGFGNSMLVRHGTCLIANVSRRVAFKEHQGLNGQGLQQSAADQFLKEMQHEITLMKRLKYHPNIVDILGVTLRDKIPILIVELGNDTLASYLASRGDRGPVTWFGKVMLCLDLVEGVKGLHYAGIVHGDLKGDNVIVFSTSGTLRAKISDFGYSSTLSSISPVGNTRCFAAPEVFSGPEMKDWKKKPELDIYGFGMVTFQVAANGIIPFQDVDDFMEAKTDLGIQILLDQVPKDTPDEFKSIIRGTSKTDPRDRMPLIKAETLLRGLLEPLSMLAPQPNYSRPIPYLSNIPTPVGSDGSDYSMRQDSPLVSPPSPISNEPVQAYPASTSEKILEKYCKREGLDITNGYRNLFVDFKHPLIWSAMEGNTEIVMLLVKLHGVDVNSATKEGLTPLHFAAAQGHEELVRILVKELGASVNAKNSGGWTPLHDAAADGKVKVVEALVSELGADKDARDVNGGTPLHWAAQHGRIGILKALAGKGADINARDANGNTPLHCAMKDESYRVEMEQVLRVLVSDHHAAVNVCNNVGDTPLHIAAGSDRVELARILVAEMGANVNARNTHGQTPLGVVAEKPWCGILMNMLRSLGGTT